MGCGHGRQLIRRSVDGPLGTRIRRTLRVPLWLASAAADALLIFQPEVGAGYAALPSSGPQVGVGDVTFGGRIGFLGFPCAYFEPFFFARYGVAFGAHGPLGAADWGRSGLAAAVGERGSSPRPHALRRGRNDLVLLRDRAAPRSSLVSLTGR